MPDMGLGFDLLPKNLNQASGVIELRVVDAHAYWHRHHRRSRVRPQQGQERVR
jgi:hypothetical protein